jgi:hypothetical protein
VSAIISPDAPDETWCIITLNAFPFVPDESKDRTH